MLKTRSHIVMALTAAAIALSACTSDAEGGGSTGTQNESSTSAPAAAPTSTQQQPTTGPTAKVLTAPPDSGTEKALEDVKLGALRVDTKGAHSAEVAITNNTSKPSNYIIDLELMSADGKTQLDTAMVSAEGVAAGKTTKVKADFASTEKLPKGAKITVVGVARIAG